jgi:hypothetical protein
MSLGDEFKIDILALLAAKKREFEHKVCKMFCDEYLEITDNPKDKLDSVIIKKEFETFLYKNDIFTFNCNKNTLISIKNTSIRHYLINDLKFKEKRINGKDNRNRGFFYIKFK